MLSNWLPICTNDNDNSRASCHGGERRRREDGLVGKDGHGLVAAGDEPRGPRRTLSPHRVGGRSVGVGRRQVGAGDGDG